ncbi:MAG: ribosome small subunit-dependent GTPase A [Coriobacteriales bacterium]|jgi:ribosome biogenesis GTPase|nr:ribosome small subunit-dependent GTPase A [Coriobacteriales bacterium]
MAQLAADADARRSQGVVVSIDRGLPLVRVAGQSLRAQHSTGLVKNTDTRSVIGDVVDVEFPEAQDVPFIVRVHPRRTMLVRRSMVESLHEGSGRFEEQVLAANMDVVLVVASLGKRPLDVGYLERQLVMAQQSGAEVVVVLTKADQARCLADDCAAARAASCGCEVIVESAVTGEGLERVASLLAPGRCGVLFGRSGVGKSTLVNELLGAPLLAVGDVRGKDRGGRHTTVARKLVELPQGGSLIDAPGLRSLGLYGACDGLALAFSDVTGLAGGCRYRDCTHTDEPDCAVKDAVDAGLLELRRLESYRAIADEVID